MPGLFGILSLDPQKPLSPERADQILKTMGEKLRHDEGYSQDSWIDPEGRLAVGRIGHSALISPAEQTPIEGFGTANIWRYGFTPSTGSMDRARVGNCLEFMATQAGAFSAVCHAVSRNEFLLFVDRRASEPIFYAIDGDWLVFAPEVKALLALGFSPGDMDPASLASFLTSGYLKPHQTHFTGIRKIPSCHGLKIENGSVHLEEYWQYNPGHLAQGEKEKDLAEQLHQIVRKSVQDNFGDPDRSIIFLSGGLDSRYILASVCEKQGLDPGSVHAVTWGESRGVAGSDPEIAEKVIRLLGVNHQFLPRQVNEYKAWFKEANYLVDGLSEIAAFHPHEYQIMKRLKAGGFQQVVRGDEAFGYLGKRFSAESALVTVQIRPMDAVPHFKRLLRDNWYDRAIDASLEDYSRLANRFQGLDFTVMKDVAYFTQRVPTYLSQAGYYKQVLFDQRNPLLSNELLDFYQKIPNRLRLHKNLFFTAFGNAYPKLAAVPYATSDSLEDWGSLLATDTPLRRFMKEEFEDEASGIWDVFDQAAVLAEFESLAVSGKKVRHSQLSGAKDQARGIARVLFPRQMDRARTKRSLARVPVTKTLLRILVLKDWHDTFVANKRWG
jgi:hypothetical protein